MIVYVAGPYRDYTDADGELWTVEGNLQEARRVALRLWEKGHFALCPHLNTAHFEDDINLPPEVYIQRDLDALAMCDAIVMMSDWQRSKGATMEHQYALRLGIPIYYDPQLPELHPTERRSPIQAAAFREVLGQMYRIHLKKNADYSPANILGTGFVGLVTRLWDKTARLLNLAGFRVTIAASSFEQPKEVFNESVEDTLLDTATYAIIGLLLRRGEWGR